MSARGVMLLLGCSALAWFAALKATGPRTAAKMPNDSEGGLMNYLSGFFSKVSAQAEQSYAAAYNARGYQYAEHINAIERKYNIPRDLLLRMAWAESSFDPNAKAKTTSASGMFQFVKATAAMLGVNPWDWRQSADGAGRYMATLYAKFKSWPLALVAYHDGPGAIADALNGGRDVSAHGANYVRKIMGVDVVALVEQQRGGMSV